jgi:hypothetical protein
MLMKQRYFHNRSNDEHIGVICYVNTLDESSFNLKTTIKILAILLLL